jgi:hypothetical protein
MVTRTGGHKDRWTQGQVDTRTGGHTDRLTQEQVVARTDVTRTGGYKDRWIQELVDTRTVVQDDKWSQGQDRTDGQKDKRFQEQTVQGKVVTPGCYKKRWTQ